MRHPHYRFEEVDALGDASVVIEHNSGQMQTHGDRDGQYSAVGSVWSQSELGGHDAQVASGRIGDPDDDFANDGYGVGYC